jgi:hypothetical protein
VAARNCTGQPQSTLVLWLERFLGPNDTGIPPGCPAIDPLPPQPASLAPFGGSTASSTTLIVPSCTATQLEVTARFTGPSGTVLGQRTADLPIAQPTR